MRILSSAAVLGLVPVPPMPIEQIDEDGSQEHLDGVLPSTQDEPESAPAPTPSPRGKWGRVLQWLGCVLNGLFVIALTVGPAGASSYLLRGPLQLPLRSGPLPAADATASPRAAKLLRPITYGMQPPGVAERQSDKTALTVTTSLETSPSKPADIVIDVIVAYTRKAASNYADIKRELVELAVAEANKSFRASNLGHIKLRLVHAYQTDYVEAGMHFDHVWRFADKGDGDMEEIHGLRDRYRADVAILIVDDAKGCGLATRVLADADEAFAVVHHECAATSYTLAHEIGHLIGARHELSYVNGAKWRDIMGYKDACGGCRRVAVWSSPTVLVNGEPAGTEQLNNARIIAEQAARVAAFR